MMLPQKIIFDLDRISIEWRHPYLSFDGRLDKKQLEAYAYDYYLRFLPLFRNTEFGSIRPGVDIRFTKRMKHQLGSASVYAGKIRLNQNYFEVQPQLLPYTLYHELTHQWLYDCHFDPGHTKRFYNKMKQFESTGLPVDPSVHIHKRIQSEGQYVYTCPQCEKRWYNNKRYRRAFYCGPCHEENGMRPIMQVYRNNEINRSQHLLQFAGLQEQ
jgi:predicted SprT family Zn-dependent metalloprotease